MDDFFDYLKFTMMTAIAGFGVVCALSLIGGSGTRMTDAELCRFRVGSSTTAQVLSMLGEPEKRSETRGVDGNATLMSYEYRDLDIKEATVLVFEKNVLTEIAATAGPRFEDVAKPRVLPACATALGPGPWQDEALAAAAQRPGPWRADAKSAIVRIDTGEHRATETFCLSQTKRAAAETS
jgi:hypothetical protein